MNICLAEDWSADVVAYYIMTVLDAMELDMCVAMPSELSVHLHTVGNVLLHVCTPPMPPGQAAERPG